MSHSNRPSLIAGGRHANRAEEWRGGQPQDLCSQTWGAFRPHWDKDTIQRKALFANVAESQGILAFDISALKNGSTALFICIGFKNQEKKKKTTCFWWVLMFWCWNQLASWGKAVRLLDSLLLLVAFLRTASQVNLTLHIKIPLAVLAVLTSCWIHITAYAFTAQNVCSGVMEQECGAQLFPPESSLCNFTSMGACLSQVWHLASAPSSNGSGTRLGTLNPPADIPETLSFERLWPSLLWCCCLLLIRQGLAR